MRINGTGRVVRGVVGIATAMSLLVACSDGAGKETTPGQAVRAGEQRPITPPPFDLGSGPAFAHQDDALVAVAAERSGGIPVTGRAARFDPAPGTWSELPTPPRLQQANAQGAQGGSVHLIGMECESAPCEEGRPKLATLVDGEWNTRDLLDGGGSSKADEFAVEPFGEFDGRAVFSLVLGSSPRIALVGSGGEIELLSDPIDNAYAACLVGQKVFALVKTEAAAAGDPTQSATARLTNARLISLDLQAGEKAAGPVAGSELTKIQSGDDEARPLCLGDAIAVVMNGAAWAWDGTANAWSKSIESGVPQPPFTSVKQGSDGRSFILTSPPTEVVGVRRGRAPEKRPAPPVQAGGPLSPRRELLVMRDAVYIYERDGEGNAPGRFLIVEGAR
jgi:hypothetical protein